ncbi:hypothetical protein LTS12_027510, partial [Elasticomyces elasticus]
MARELGPVNCTTWDWWYFDAMPDDVYISTWDDSSSEGSGPNNASWSSTPDLRIWTVNFNADVVNGSMKYSSVAPPHLPCRLPTPGATEEIVPHVGRANAVPDLMVSVEFTINGTDLKLAGPGYHDKKWGDQLFSNSTDYWHGRLGPYYIIWVDAGSSVDGQEYFSAYVARDARLISGSCVAGESVVARPWSNNETADALHPHNGPGSRETDGFELVFVE